jgi:transcriptional regulator with XRE-family HTH domain
MNTERLTADRLTLHQPEIALREHERRRLLSAFLAEHRHRIDPMLPVLGEHRRGVEAIGTLVTPREIADAVGINRRWYELAERGEPTRASAAVLRDVGDVLGLNPRERAVLVRLATPAAERDTPRDQALEIRDAFASLQRYLRKLYACTTAEEVLTLLEETAAGYFPEASYVTTASRLPDGCWSLYGEGIGRAARLRAFENNREEVIAPIFTLEPLAADAITCFPDVSFPGDLIRYSDHDELRLARMLGKAYAGFRQLHEPMLAAVVRSRTNFVAHLYLGDFRKSYDNETDRALVSAIVEFASLASWL